MWNSLFSRYQARLAFVLCMLAGSAIAGDSRTVNASGIDPANWPTASVSHQRDPQIEQRITALLQRMSIAEKVGQLIQADISSITPDEVREFNIGSILSGGNSGPYGELRAAPAQWLKLADEFWYASTDTRDGGVGIPVIWGIDAVHGHNNIAGATIFPHNIGFGATGNPALVRRAAAATALAVRATGQDWTFAPTLAVVQNDRWGRTYESYSENPALVAQLGTAMVEGLQGKSGTEAFLGADHVVATAKHFIGDGGTANGKDQGDFIGSEQQLRLRHAPGYYAAIGAGAQSVMASFSSYHGASMHGHQTLLQDVLRERIGFDGLMLGDWNGHARVPGCANWQCPEAFTAGMDMLMVPNDWKGFFWLTLDQVWRGEIARERLDDAVARVLRMKIRAGLLDAAPPSQRRHAGNVALLNGLENRAIARDAVRQSLVLLKNEQGVLPLPPQASVLVTGPGASNLPMQTGGWTLSWQGDENTNADFPHGSTIHEGIAAAVSAAGGHVEYSADGSYSERPDVAVVVFGESPYSEFFGDRENVDYAADDALQLLATLRRQNIPVVSIFLSGRPLVVNAELANSDAFIAAWLPGTEGAGIADVLIAAPDGSPRFDFTGRLAFSWPRRADQAAVNIGDAEYRPLFEYGYGLDYSRRHTAGVFAQQPRQQRRLQRLLELTTLSEADLEH